MHVTSHVLFTQIRPSPKMAPQALLFPTQTALEMHKVTKTNTWSDSTHSLPDHYCKSPTDESYRAAARKYALREEKNSEQVAKCSAWYTIISTKTGTQSAHKS